MNIITTNKKYSINSRELFQAVKINMKPRHSANSTPKTNMAEVMHRIGYHVTVWTLAWLLCACVCPVHCGVDKRCPSTDIQMSSQGICGNQLSNILQILCGSGGYNKRSVPGEGNYCDVIRCVSIVVTSYTCFFYVVL